MADYEYKLERVFLLRPNLAEYTDGDWEPTLLTLEPPETFSPTEHTRPRYGWMVFRRTRPTAAPPEP